MPNAASQDALPLIPKLSLHDSLYIMKSCSQKGAAFRLPPPRFWQLCPHKDCVSRIPRSAAASSDFITSTVPAGHAKQPVKPSLHTAIPYFTASERRVKRLISHWTVTQHILISCFHCPWFCRKCTDQPFSFQNKAGLQKLQMHRRVFPSVHFSKSYLF